MSDSERLDSLERTIAKLSRELGELRAEVRAASIGRGSLSAVDSARDPRIAGADRPIVGPALVTQPPLSGSTGSVAIPIEPAMLAGAASEASDLRSGVDRRTTPGRRSVDFESLIGRYGTLALAALTILMGVGAFLGWAIANGKLGPEVRVVLGALAAAAVAVFGWRLRQRGATRFGNTMLALALAIVHLDAWGAGPELRIVPEPIALAVAAIASAALAVLALQRDDAALFSVGVGGALIAPFVTSSGRGSAVALLVYGYLVLAAGIVALRGREWRIPKLLVSGGVWWYVVAGAGLTPPNPSWLRSELPAVFALACAWTALAASTARAHANVAQSAMIALVAFLIVDAVDRSPALDIIPFAAAGTLTAYATLRATPLSWRQKFLGAVALPLGCLAAAVFALPSASPLRGAALAVVWTAGAIVAAGVLGEATRGAHIMVAGLASGLALVLALSERRVPLIISLSAHAAVLSLAMRRERTRLLCVPAVIGLLLATGSAYDLLEGRMPYGYRPFLTLASLAAAAASIGWLIFSWNASRIELSDGGPWTPPQRTFVRILGGVIAFGWVREELQDAISPDVATFLLILYYALVGVAAIFIGRARRIPALRHLGLGLAIYGALKAVVQASSLAIGLRVGSYLLAGLFLLAVAYWYRAREEEAATMGKDPTGSTPLEAWPDR